MRAKADKIIWNTFKNIHLYINAKKQRNQIKPIKIYSDSN